MLPYGVSVHSTLKMQLLSQKAWALTLGVIPACSLYGSHTSCHPDLSLAGVQIFENTWIPAKAKREDGRTLSCGSWNPQAFETELVHAFVEKLQMQF
jgi:hypothetical protein